MILDGKPASIKSQNKFDNNLYRTEGSPPGLWQLVRIFKEIGALLLFCEDYIIPFLLRSPNVSLLDRRDLTRPYVSQYYFGPKKPHTLKKLKRLRLAHTMYPPNTV
jgi:hypothetical protein